MPPTNTPLDPFSEEYHQALLKAVEVDSPKYAHVDPDTLQEFLQPATYAHNTSPIPGADHETPFFLMFGRHAPSPEVFSYDLPPAPLSQSSYARELIERSIETRKSFDRIKVDLKRSQREYCDMISRDLHIPDVKRVCVPLPPPSSTPKEAASGS